MKNIIIGGTVRSGKTTLANLVREKLGYSKIESDTIVNAFDVAMPEIGIRHKTPERTREIYEPFLFEILNGLNRDLKYGGNVSVFPGSQFLPENISRYEKKDKFIIIFLGVGDCEPKELLKKFRENDKESDWTSKKDDEWLLVSCEKIIKESDEIKKQCEKFGFYYFDTFKNREEVLEEICEKIENLQKK